MDWTKVGKFVVKYVLPLATTGIGIAMSDKMEKERIDQMADIVAEKLRKEGVKA